ncbi:hypothetical protein [Tabrizicola sp.]|uniref:hypothetical protein n=1 Tax=Tabrizicola sp. TaxID=2005166 RepID=UPI003F2D5723
MRLAVLIALLATPSLADGGITVQLPDDAKIAEAATPEFLTELVNANVIGMNCPGFEIDQGEWTLITGTADKVAEAIGVMDAGEYDDKFYGPAFAMLDKPESCAKEGPKIDPLIERLKAMGGDTKPIG